MTRRVVAMLLVTAAVGLGLSACDLNAIPHEEPDDVRVSVYQPRPDVAKNRIAIQIHNDGSEPITITSARLNSSYFSDPFVWEPGTATVPPGYAIDLRVDIPLDAVCDGRPAEHSVSFTWTQGDASGAWDEVPDDPFHVLDLLHDAACLVESVDGVATLTARTLTPPALMPGPADLLITAFPHPSSQGSFTIDAVHSTTLLNPAGPDGVGVSELPLGIEVSAAGPDEVHIPIVPNRCDAHALAEDKVGTRIPLYVTGPDGTEGRLVLAADNDLRAQMYAFYRAYCGL
ncbi:MAG: hypothetical protein KF727_05480 [Microbacteriaceae bacterium]|nr:hypothetical protein [Microbacteriaceae bacterium]